MTKIEQNDWLKHLLCLLLYGNREDISLLRKRFHIYHSFRNQSDINMIVFKDLINSSNIQNKQLIDFFKLIVKSVESFEMSSDTPEKVGEFLSAVIRLALTQNCIYELRMINNKEMTIKIHNLPYCLYDTPIPRARSVRGEVDKNHTLRIYIGNGISLENYLSCRPKYKKSNSQRFISVHKRIHDLIGENNAINREYCPYCNPLVKQNPNTAKKSCPACKKIFKMISSIFADKDDIKRLRAVFTYKNPKDRSAMQIRQRRWKNFEKSFNKKYNSAKENEMLKSENSNLKREVLKLVKKQLHIQTKDLF